MHNIQIYSLVLWVPGSVELGHGSNDGGCCWLPPAAAALRCCLLAWVPYTWVVVERGKGKDDIFTGTVLA